MTDQKATPKRHGAVHSEALLRPGPFKSVRARLIISFLLVVVTVTVVTEVAALFGLPFTADPGTLALRRSDAFAGLSLVADIKKGRVSDWFSHKIADAQTLAKNEMVTTRVRHLNSAWRGLSSRELGPGDLWSLLRNESSFEDLEGLFQGECSARVETEGISLADLETGTVFMSTRAADLGADLSGEPFFRQIMRHGGEYVGDVAMDAQSGRLILTICHVIADAAPEPPSTALVMQLDVARVLGPILHTGRGLGERGEALLVRQDGRILTTLRHPLADGTVARPLVYRIEALPAVLAAQGEEGIVEARDYRGVPVLAAFRHIRVTTEWGWGLVVKRDRSELLAPVRNTVLSSVVSAALVILILLALVIPLTHRLTAPIVSLGQAAQRVASGDLDARAAVTTSDEVGALATTFNSMVEQIQGWRHELDERVRSRTADLSRTTRELETEIERRSRVEEELRQHRDHLEALVTQRTAELERRIGEVEKLNRAMLNLADDLQTTNADLETAARRLEQTNRELETFSYSVSHDLRAPLRHVSGFVTLLEDRSSASLDDEGKRYLRLIAESAERMDRLVNALLAFSRAAQVGLHKAPLDLQRLVEELVAELGEGTADREIEWVVGALPVVRADRTLIRQVVVNLLDNAVKYTRAREHARIEIGSTAGDDNELVVFVRDNGVGFDPDFADRLFGVFQRLHRAEDFEGAGIGLANVRRIIGRHGGRTWAEGQVEEGATFFFSLPREEEGEVRGEKCEERSTKDEAGVRKGEG